MSKEHDIAGFTINGEIRSCTEIATGSANDDGAGELTDNKLGAPNAPFCPPAPTLDILALGNLSSVGCVAK